MLGLKDGQRVKNLDCVVLFVDAPMLDLTRRACGDAMFSKSIELRCRTGEMVVIAQEEEAQ